MFMNQDDSTNEPTIGELPKLPGGYRWQGRKLVRMRGEPMPDLPMLPPGYVWRVIRTAKAE